ncbi:MAG: hypothetical protein ABIG30_00400 [Candidatus Aenigmatarchaeota archaeon]
MKKLLLVFLIIIVTIVSGCSSQPPASTPGLSISLAADPPEVFANSDTSLQFKIENNGDRTFHDIRVIVYDIGEMQEPRATSLQTPKPNIPSRGDNDYCTQKLASGYGPCQHGEGDCDSYSLLRSDISFSSECASGLECRTTGSGIWETLVNWLSKADICCSPGESDDSCLQSFSAWASGSDSDAIRFTTSEGIFSCAYGRETLRPNGLASYACNLRAPPASEMMLKIETTYVRTKSTFVTNISVPAIVGLIAEDEYIRQKNKGELSSGRSTFTKNDGNIQIDVSFSEPMPIVDRPDKEEYMYIDIRNVGDGVIDDIRPQDIVIWDTSATPSQGYGPMDTQTTITTWIEDILGVSRNGRAVSGALFEDVFIGTDMQHGEKGCLFDFQCAGNLMCKSATYLSPGDNLCCNPNEDSVMNQNGVAQCKTLEQQNPYVVNLATEIVQPGECDIEKSRIPLRPSYDVFPRITCKMKLPSNIKVISNHVFIITLGYRYEIRQELPITIMK